MECLKLLGRLKMRKYISLINGKFSNTVSVLDRGLSYGDGLFETMSWIYIKDRNRIGVEFWKRHLERIKKSCFLTKIKMPSISLLNNYKKTILQKSINNGLQGGILKILITRGVGGRGYKFEKEISPTVIFLSFPMVKLDQGFLKKGVNVRFCKSPIFINSQLAGLKHLNRMDSVMARSEWEDQKYFEGILLDDSDNIIDGTMTNIFFSKNNILYTPLIGKSGINGIMRQVVIEKSSLFFDKVREINIKKNSIESFDEMFLTNSLIKIISVKKLLKKNFKKSESTRKLIDYFCEEKQKNKNLELV